MNVSIGVGASVLVWMNRRLPAPATIGFIYFLGGNFLMNPHTF